MDHNEAPVGQADRFEFGPEHGRLIADLGSKMHFVGVLVIILGAIALLSALLQLPSDGVTGGTVVAVLSAVFLVAVGIWSMRSGREFLLVARTEGADIPHLIRALENLRRLFSLQYILAWIGLLMLVGAIVFGFFVDQAR